MRKRQQPQDAPSATPHKKLAKTSTTNGEQALHLVTPTKPNMVRDESTTKLLRETSAIWKSTMKDAPRTGATAMDALHNVIVHMTTSAMATAPGRQTLPTSQHAEQPMVRAGPHSPFRPAQAQQAPTPLLHPTPSTLQLASSNATMKFQQFARGLPRRREEERLAGSPADAAHAHIGHDFPRTAQHSSYTHVQYHNEFNAAVWHAPDPHAAQGMLQGNAIPQHEVQQPTGQPTPPPHVPRQPQQQRTAADMPNQYVQPPTAPPRCGGPATPPPMGIPSTGAPSGPQALNMAMCAFNLTVLSLQQHVHLHPTQRTGGPFSHRQANRNRPRGTRGARLNGLRVFGPAPRAQPAPEAEPEPAQPTATEERAEEKPK